MRFNYPHERPSIGGFADRARRDRAGAVARQTPPGLPSKTDISPEMREFWNLRQELEWTEPGSPRQAAAQARLQELWQHLDATRPASIPPGQEEFWNLGPRPGGYNYTGLSDLVRQSQVSPDMLRGVQQGRGLMAAGIAPPPQVGLSQRVNAIIEQQRRGEISEQEADAEILILLRGQTLTPNSWEERGLLPRIREREAKRAAAAPPGYIRAEDGSYVPPSFYDSAPQSYGSAQSLTRLLQTNPQVASHLQRGLTPAAGPVEVPPPPGPSFAERTHPGYPYSQPANARYAPPVPRAVGGVPTGYAPPPTARPAARPTAVRPTAPPGYIRTEDGTYVPPSFYDGMAPPMSPYPPVKPYTEAGPRPRLNVMPGSTGYGVANLPVAPPPSNVMPYSRQPAPSTRKGPGPMLPAPLPRAAGPSRQDLLAMLLRQAEARRGARPMRHLPQGY